MYKMLQPKRRVNVLNSLLPSGGDLDAGGDEAAEQHKVEQLKLQENFTRFIESDIRCKTQPLKEQLTSTINHLYTIFEPNVFIASCRGYWDRMGQLVLSFLESRKENRSWYKGSRIAVSILDNTFASQMQQLLGNSPQEKDLEPPRVILSWYQSTIEIFSSSSLFLLFLSSFSIMSDTSTSVATPLLNTVYGSDTSHPYYLHASDTPGIVLVNTPFTGRGFAGWRRSILISLSAKNKLGFIDDACPAPSSTDVSFRLWNRCNDMVIFWLLNSLSKDIADSVLYSRTTKDLWIDLEHRF
ncbi:hypothetical protein FXO37_26543 [Capsicum annuum]|nr:hypothetical protein FXO37_26543 [Capsicum annuum]